MTALARRRPWIVARQAVTLDHLSQGRLIFGAGLGFDRRDFAGFGEETDLAVRAEMLDEGLAVLAGLWSGESFSFRGRHYRVEQARFLPGPVQKPRIPIWVAGGWPRRKPFRRAAQWDGLYLMTKKANGETVTPADLGEIAAYVRAQRQSPVPFEIAFAGETPADPARSGEVVRPYAEAGLTWWLEGLWGTLEAARARIRSGPPRLV